MRRLSLFLFATAVALAAGSPTARDTEEPLVAREAVVSKRHVPYRFCGTPGISCSEALDKALTNVEATPVIPTSSTGSDTCAPSEISPSGLHDTAGDSSDLATIFRRTASAIDLDTREPRKPTYGFCRALEISSGFIVDSNSSSKNGLLPESVSAVDPDEIPETDTVDNDYGTSETVSLASHVARDPDPKHTIKYGFCGAPGVSCGMVVRPENNGSKPSPAAIPTPASSPTEVVSDVSKRDDAVTAAPDNERSESSTTSTSVHLTTWMSGGDDDGGPPYHMVISTISAANKIGECPVIAVGAALAIFVVVTALL